MNSFILNSTFFGYHFYEPQWLWALLTIPLLLFLFYLRIRKSSGIVKFSRPAAELKQFSSPILEGLVYCIYGLLLLGVASLVLAFAKPYLPHSEDIQKNYDEGIDIIIAMDISGSMMAQDFKPNRLTVAKKVAKEFIDGRRSDKIGFVAFEGEAYMACPTTRNYSYLKETIDEIQPGLILPGTAIGTGLGTAVAHLTSDSLQSKVIILLTDGVSNRGSFSPLEAAQLAVKEKITVYTIGVGKRGFARMPVNTPFGTIMQKTKVTIDEKVLKKIASLTGGKYFRATNENSLRSIYSKIDDMETRKITTTKIKHEPPYSPEAFLIIGCLILTLAFSIEQFLLRKNG